VKYLELVLASLFQHKIRSALTLISVVAAFTLFGLLDSLKVTFEHAGQSVRGIDRLYTTSKISGVELPLRLHASLKEVPGVTMTTYGSALVGTYQNVKNVVLIEAQADNVFELYPESQVSPADLEMYQNSRTGALVRADFAKKYQWKAGDRIPFQTSVYQKSGSTSWTFDVIGIYDLPEPKAVLPPVMIHWSFFDETRQSGNGTVGWYNAIVADPDQAEPVAYAIDSLSANSPYETVTQSENAFFAGLSRQFANVGLIVGGTLSVVFFTLLLLTGSAMAQAVRERTVEVAVLKTIGFTNRKVLLLILSEALLLLLLGATAGLAIAEVAVAVARARLGHVLPMPLIAGDIWIQGLALAALIAVVVGGLPAWRGMSLRIVDALAH
jgi:putative ABC transport system permease protein